jgi:hypothetical protein
MIKSNSRSKNIAVMIRTTARHKIRHIKKALLKAKGKAVEELEKRLVFWERNL